MSDSECFVTCLETLGMSFSMHDATTLLCPAAATRLRQTPISCWSPKISTSPVPTSQLQSCFQQHLTKLTHASPYTLPACVLASESCLSVTSLCQTSSLFYLSCAAGLDPQPSSISYQHPFLPAWCGPISWPSPIPIPKVSHFQIQLKPILLEA